MIYSSDTSQMLIHRLIFIKFFYYILLLTNKVIALNGVNFMITYHPKRSVTLKDIAVACNVSVNTVSHALNDKSDISVETKKMISKTAKEMGYIRNYAASSMRSGQTKTITLIISDISNPLFGIMAKEIESQLAKNKYTLFIINTDGNTKAELNAVKSAISKTVDGIIICPTQNNTDAIELMESYGIPYILMGRRFDDIQTDYVVWDDVKGGYLATDYLIRKGHRRILFMNASLLISSARERLKGYCKALEQHHIPYDPDLVYSSSLHSTEIRDILISLQEDHFPTGIFAFSDFAACETISILKEIKPNLFNSITVVGFDDIQSSLVFPLSISSISTPKAEMAQHLVTALLSKIQLRDKATPYQKVIDTNITIR